MGQRLVIEFLYDGEPILASYYHWSAYTQSTMDILNQMITGKGFWKPASKKEAMFQALQMVENVTPYDSEGAAWNDYDVPDEQKGFNKLKAMFPDDDETSSQIREYGKRLCRKENRNDGLVVVGSKDCEDMEGAAEYLTFIELDSQTIRMEVFSYYSNIREFVDWNEAVPVPFTVETNSQCKSLDLFHYDDIPQVITLLDFVQRHGCCCSTYSGAHDEDCILGIIA